jgi:hypothetical protein
MKKKILFVTRGGERCDEGFSYSLELAKTLHAGIEVLIIGPSCLAAEFEDIMAAATFAEEGELKTAGEIMKETQRACSRKLEARVSEFLQETEGGTADFLCHIMDGDMAPAINRVLKDRPYVDMVLLSPSLSEKVGSSHVKKLLKNISKPIVHISKPAAAEI